MTTGSAARNSCWLGDSAHERGSLWPVRNITCLVGFVIGSMGVHAAYSFGLLVISVGGLFVHVRRSLPAVGVQQISRQLLLRVQKALRRFEHRVAERSDCLLELTFWTWRCGAGSLW